MSEQERPSIREITLQWALNYGNRIPVLLPQKIEAFTQLLQMYESYGYGKSDITNSVKAQILEFCSPENYIANKLKTWKRLNLQGLDQAIVDHFKVVKPVELDKSRLTKPIEQPAYEKKPDNVLNLEALKGDTFQSDFSKTEVTYDEEFLKLIGGRSDE